MMTVSLRVPALSTALLALSLACAGGEEAKPPAPPPPAPVPAATVPSTTPSGGSFPSCCVNTGDGGIAEVMPTSESACKAQGEVYEWQTKAECETVCCEVSEEPEGTKSYAFTSKLACTGGGVMQTGTVLSDGAKCEAAKAEPKAETKTDDKPAKVETDTKAATKDEPTNTRPTSAGDSSGGRPSSAGSGTSTGGRPSSAGSGTSTGGGRPASSGNGRPASKPH